MGFCSTENPAQGGHWHVNVQSEIDDQALAAVRFSGWIGNFAKIFWLLKYKVDIDHENTSTVDKM